MQRIECEPEKQAEYNVRANTPHTHKVHTHTHIKKRAPPGFCRISLALKASLANAPWLVELSNRKRACIPGCISSNPGTAFSFSCFKMSGAVQYPSWFLHQAHRRRTGERRSRTWCSRRGRAEAQHSRSSTTAVGVGPGGAAAGRWAVAVVAGDAVGG